MRQSVAVERHLEIVANTPETTSICFDAFFEWLRLPNLLVS